MGSVIDQLPGIVVATLGGAAVGVERQRSGHAAGPDARFGGIRTFTLIGGLAGVAGTLAVAGWPLFGALLVGGALALIVAGYVAASRRDVDGTTEVAALVVVAAGIVAGIDQLGLAAGMIAVTVLLLAEKPRLHAIVLRVDDPTLQAAIRFAVMSVVVLPLLPEGPFGPGPGIRPRTLWLLVLLFSGLSFAGFVGRRLAGRAAYPVTGLLGGLVSSTSVTLTFARLSRTDDRNASALAAGAVAACTILFVRVAVAITVLNRELLPAVSWYLIPPFLVGVLAMLVGWRAARASSDEPAVLNNPLQFRAAIEMAALFQLVLFAVDFVRRYLGTGGLLATGFVLGLTDVDALTISMARSAATGTSAQIAGRAIALGILANTLVKLGIALMVGRRRFAGHAGIPLLVMAAILLALIAA